MWFWPKIKKNAKNGQNDLKWKKNKTTFIFWTFKVSQNKVVFFFNLSLFWPIFGHFVIFVLFYYINLYNKWKCQNWCRLEWLFPKTLIINIIQDTKWQYNFTTGFLFSHFFKNWHALLAYLTMTYPRLAYLTMTCLKPAYRQINI